MENEENEEQKDYMTIDDLRPQKGDIILNTKGKKNELINTDANSNSFFIVAHSYFNGAQNLADDVNNVKGDFLIYPIVYLYGHYLELILKEIIRLGLWYKEDTDLELSKCELKENHRHHNLLSLWKMSKELMYKIHPKAFNEVKDEIEVLDKCVNDLHFLYGNANNFRYPDMLPDNIKQININTLRNTMARVEGTINGYYLGLCEKVREEN